LFVQALATHVPTNLPHFLVVVVPFGVFGEFPLVGLERVLCAWKFDKLLFDFIAVFAQNSFLFVMANFLGVFLHVLFIFPIFSFY